MKSTIVNKSVLVVGLILAVSLAVFAIKTRYPQDSTPITPEPTVIPTVTTQPSPVSDTKLRKRPVGTETWLQYTDEKNMVAFLYPQNWYVNSDKFPQKENEVVLQLGFSPQESGGDFAGIITMLSLSESEALNRMERLFLQSFQEGTKFQPTSNLEINGYNFIIYSPFDKKYDKMSFFLAEINANKSIQLSFDMNNDVAKSIIKTLILDGTRFED